LKAAQELISWQKKYGSENAPWPSYLNVVIWPKCV